MYISHAKVLNFRALQSVSIPLNKFSILLGENDVGKTSFLYALDTFFANKKISDPADFFKNETPEDISIVITFSEIPESENLKKFQKTNGDITISKVFSFEKPPVVKAILDDGSECAIDKKVLDTWFSSDSFHFIPVRRDLTVQFSMKKEALLGKTLRAKMKAALADDTAKTSVENVAEILKRSIESPEATLQRYLQEQMHNEQIKLEFKDLNVDPIEGVSFVVRLSDDRVEDILIQNRGAGTQNNLIIALFRLVASLHVGGYFIFAMEEPENSLHPKAQRQLLSVIQDISKESQVICTTHSPVFLERSRFENNIILTRTINGNTIAKTFNISLLKQLRTDLGVRPSDALLKGGGNCAIIVEGNTEEDGFPVFMEMLGMSEFQLGIAIINLRGSDKEKVKNVALLLAAYDIPCVVVLDNNAKKTAEDIERERGGALKNIKNIFCLKKGNIEDYYPLETVAAVMNQELALTKPVTVSDFDQSKHGHDRLSNFKHVMYEHGAGDSMGVLKRALGSVGTKMMRDQKLSIDPELVEIFNEVKKIAQGEPLAELVKADR